MKPHFHKLVLVSGTLILAAFAAPMTAAAYIDSNGRIIEGFENGTLPDNPVSQHYTFALTGSGASGFDTSTFDTGAQSYKLDGITGLFIASFDLKGLNLCADAEEVGSSRHIDFAVRSNQANGGWAVRLRNAAGTDYAIMEAQQSGGSPGLVSVKFDNSLNTHATQGVFTDSVDTTWKHYGIRCSNLSATFTDFTAVQSISQTFATGTFNPTVAEFISVGTAIISSAFDGQPPIVNFDNIGFGHPLTPGLRFCANPTVAGFEYTYVADWDYETGLGPGQGITTDDGFVAIMPTTQTAYMAKGFTTGSQAFRVAFRIEAGVEGSDSIFGVAFTTGAGGLPSGSTKGSGLEATGFDGGNFDNSYQAIFQEDGNDWVIRIVESLAGTQTQLGGTVLHGDPNSPSSYQFEVDSVAQTARILDGNGDEIFSRSAGQFTTTTYKDQWFGATSYLTTLFDPTTVLDDADPDEEGIAGEDSTCIYDLLGSSAVNGGAGLQPVVDHTNDGGEVETAGGVIAAGTTIPEGWTAAAFNGFLGVILMGSIGGGAWAIFNRHWVAFLIGSVMGFILALLFQLFSLWVLIAVLLIAVAIIFLQVKRGAGASG